ncbi:acetolactate synthase, large subunit, biosynthetic type [Marispirochaeta aestuarii]|uniref:Acetolactate synthase n=1 Tax=Marispirochaeta aestuarii TaxID=1963862 RepID=A0A1Y1S195_9SPIO|nr:biosynthetic-type acetolactate synthase large subunit [Marispirochaeta aestuarii]ORC37203.1 acetolactate synthase, large subunit, biosynthetic type [Marispirochaeta aestuarii]
MKGTEVIVEALKKERVEIVFGYPGGAVIPLFDQLYGEKSIRLVLTRHEQAAVHAADGYARSTGRPGVCIVTSGPGATNTVTGLATANFDSVPLVCISGQVPRQMIGNDAFQEADTVGITRPVTKHNYLVTDVDKLGRIVREGFFIASSGRPGPVVIDVPKDIMTSDTRKAIPETVHIRGYNPVTSGHAVQIKRAATAINKARRPLIFAGGGLHIANAAEELKELLEKISVPMVTSLMGIGAVPADHPLNLGMIGMHGSYAANMAVQKADLLLGIGVRFDDRATGDLSRFAPEAQIIHIDIDPAAIARNVPVSIPIVGDAKQTLTDLMPLVERRAPEEWLAEVRNWSKYYKSLDEVSTDNSDDLTARRTIQLLGKTFPDAIVSTEVGQNQMWAAQFFPFTRSRSWLTSGGLGTMGYGFPAAIGAQAGNPDQKVLVIAGDGSIQMNIQELATAVLDGFPVIIAILNNGYLGMVRQWQELFYNRRYAKTCLEAGIDCPPDCSDPRVPGAGCPPYVPDFVALAEAYGAVGLRAATVSEAVKAVETAAAEKDRPVIIDFIIPREENVWPMVAPGAALHEMLGKGGPL